MPMTRAHKSKAKKDDPAQSKRFIETAKAIGASEDPKDFDKAFKKVVRPKGRLS
ncbi:MAG: hypothetical protein ABSD21_09455 [Rhizomicrobium sp.]|jgi:hypothetical protein